MSYSGVYIHMVFTTKYNRGILDDSIRRKIFFHILENAKAKGINLVCLNGYTNHLHCLIRLGRELSISRTAQLIKGESSYWINQNKLLKQKFSWQDDYWVTGVEMKNVESVRQYILKQEEHHRRLSDEEVMKNFLRDHGFSRG